MSWRWKYKLLTCVKASMLLNMGQLLETSVAIGALVGFLSGMNTYVLNQLMIWWERFEALLALMGFWKGSTFRSRTRTCPHELPMLAKVMILGCLLSRCRLLLLLLLQLHCRFVHEYLQVHQKKQFIKKYNLFIYFQFFYQHTE